MSSMRNAVQRRNHKERAQPVEREKWGVLEKHKDYSLRAKDYNEKKKRLKILREKAAERNPDEFHFGMIDSKTRNGGQKLGDRGNKVLSHDALKLLKTQDAGYLRIMAQKTTRARERLEQELVLGEGRPVELLRENNIPGTGQHVVYVGSQEEQNSFARAGARGKGDEDGSASQAGGERSNVIPIADERILKEERTLRKQHKRLQEARRAKLEALRVRERDLTAAEQELEIQRARMGNSIGGVTKAGMKWKVRERKK